MRRSIPWRLGPPLLWAMLRRRRRSLRADAGALLGGLEPAPLVLGSEHIPRDGGFCVVANHYQRPSLWIGWAGSLIGQAVAEVRGGDPPVAWLVIAELRLRLGASGLVVPGTRWAFRAIAHTWGFVPLPTGPGAELGRARALATLVRLTRQNQPVGLFPEGQAGRAGPLRPPLRGAGAAIERLGRAGVPALPVGVYEDGDRLCARFGPPFDPTAPANLSGRERDRHTGWLALRRIAELLPPRLHGAVSRR